MPSRGHDRELGERDADGHYAPLEAPDVLGGLKDLDRLPATGNADGPTWEVTNRADMASHFRDFRGRIYNGGHHLADAGLWIQQGASRVRQAFKTGRGFTDFAKAAYHAPADAGRIVKGTVLSPLNWTCQRQRANRNPTAATRVQARRDWLHRRREGPHLAPHDPAPAAAIPPAPPNFVDRQMPAFQGILNGAIQLHNAAQARGDTRSQHMDRVITNLNPQEGMRKAIHNVVNLSGADITRFCTGAPPDGLDHAAIDAHKQAHLDEIALRKIQALRGLEDARALDHTAAAGNRGTEDEIALRHSRAKAALEKYFDETEKEIGKLHDKVKTGLRATDGKTKEVQTDAKGQYIDLGDEIYEGWKLRIPPDGNPAGMRLERSGFVNLNRLFTLRYNIAAIVTRHILDYILKTRNPPPPAIQLSSPTYQKPIYAAGMFVACLRKGMPVRNRRGQPLKNVEQFLKEYPVNKKVFSLDGWKMAAYLFPPVAILGIFSTLYHSFLKALNPFSSEIREEAEFLHDVDEALKSRGITNEVIREQILSGKRDIPITDEEVQKLIQEQQRKEAADVAARTEHRNTVDGYDRGGVHIDGLAERRARHEGTAAVRAGDGSLTTAAVGGRAVHNDARVVEAQQRDARKTTRDGTHSENKAKKDAKELRTTRTKANAKLLRQQKRLETLHRRLGKQREGHKRFMSHLKRFAGEIKDAVKPYSESEMINAARGTSATKLPHSSSSPRHGR